MLARGHAGIPVWLPLCLGTGFLLTRLVPRLASYFKYLYRSRVVHPKIAERRRALLLSRIAASKALATGTAGNAPAANSSDCQVLAGYSVEQLLALMNGATGPGRAVPALPSGLYPEGEKVSAVYVLKCFLLNAIAAHERTNCLTILIPDSALADAQRADALRANPPAGPLPLLLGVPVSIKESIGLLGCDATMGLHHRCFEFASGDSAAVALLRSEGAVIFATTNVPQTLMSYECENFIFGTTTNPVNPAFTPGGSSGGEGSLIAAGGSIVGIGTDIGGSIRHPAAFCGIYALKPGTLRVPYRGCVASGRTGQEGIAPTAGPLAAHVEDLAVISRVLMGASSEAFRRKDCIDGRAMRTGWRQDVYEAEAQSARPLTIAYTTHSGVVEASPANARAVREAVAALKAAGHNIVEMVQLPGGEGLLRLFYSIIAADDAEDIRRDIEHERIIPFLKPLLLAFNINRICRPLVWLATYLRYRSSFYASVISGVGQCTLRAIYGLVADRNDLRDAYAEATAGYDAVIVPSFTTPAPRLRGTTDTSFSIAFTAPFNVLDTPVAVVPVTHVDPEQDMWLAGSGPLEEFLRRDVYDAKAMAGLPVGIQVVGHRGQEEQLLAITARIDKAIKEFKKSNERTSTS